MIKDLHDLKIFANENLLKFNQSEPSSNFCFLFYASMGAGKTTLIREFGQALGIKENITSPTFVGMNEYHCDNFNFYHYDLYQVGIKFEDLAEIFHTSKQNLLVIEWAEKLEDAHYNYLSRNCKIIKIKIDVNQDETRTVELS
jgi:tRNA threonylcarbamoyladenosine biosynthesis protein TsaE